jgi:hypothetical protein
MTVSFVVTIFSATLASTVQETLSLKPPHILASSFSATVAASVLAHKFKDNNATKSPANNFLYSNIWLPPSYRNSIIILN